MFHSSLVLAFGFANLAILGWLAAAAAPLLIHLWSRHRYREAPWAAMQFLLAAMRKNARRLQLQQWLLLAVRTLIIALVVLAAAEPYGEQLLAGGSRSPTHQVLVIDASYSMACRDNNASRFGRAKQLAASLVRDSRPADTFTVIQMATPAKTILGREVIDHRTIAAEIESLEPTHTAADLAGALTLVDEALSAKTNQRSAPTRHEVHFFTDLQLVTWGERRREDQSAIRNPQSAIHDRIAKLAQRARLTLIDVGHAHVPNLAVTRLTCSDPFITSDREVAFDVTLHQFSTEPRPNCAVELLVDDVPVGEQTVDVPAAGDAAVRFTHRFRSPGDHVVSVRAAGDDLAIDDARWLVVPVRDEVRVLCVAGRDGAAKYVANALNPDPAGNSPIRPIVVTEGDVAELDFSEFDCLFLCNVAQFTSSEAQRLRRYAADGGGVVFFLGDRVVADSYNALADDKQPLLPARLSELVSQPQFGLDPLDYRHPIVAPFRGRERAGLLTTPVARYYRLGLPSNRPEVEVAARLPNGDPFIVAAPFGRGRAVLVATAGSLSSVDVATGEPWTNWPTWPSFLPIVRELLAYAAAGRQTQLQQPVGTMLGGALPAADDEPGRDSFAAGSIDVGGESPVAKESRPLLDLRIVRPDGRTDPVSVESAADGWRWTYGPTDRSGMYSLRGSTRDDLPRLAVNVDTAESDLAKVDARQLPPELLLHDADPETNDGARSQVSRAGWSQSFLWLALAMLLVESYLAWRFGRGVV